MRGAHLAGLRGAGRLGMSPGRAGCWRGSPSLPAGLSPHGAHQGWGGLRAEPRCSLHQAARLPTITTIRVPEGYAWQEITAFLMKEHGLEIAGGLGPSVGKVSSALPSHLPPVPPLVSASGAPRGWPVHAECWLHAPKGELLRVIKWLRTQLVGSHFFTMTEGDK